MISPIDPPFTTLSGLYSVCTYNVHRYHDPHAQYFDDSQWTQRVMISPIDPPFTTLSGLYSVCMDVHRYHDPHAQYFQLMILSGHTAWWSGLYALYELLYSFNDEHYPSSLYARLQTGHIMVWWCPIVRVSVRPSVRPGLRLPVFHSFLIHALTYWAEILHITLFQCTSDQVQVSSLCVNFWRSYASFGT